MAMWRDWRQRLWGWLGAGNEAPVGAAVGAGLDAQGLRMQEVGAGNVQVGQVGGDLHTDHSTHQHTARVAQSGHLGTGAVHMGHVQNVTQVHQHFYAAVEPDPGVGPAGARPVATAAQVLALMDRLPEPVRLKVLDFMRREFGTSMVIELQPHQLYRARRYVEAIGHQRPANAAQGSQRKV